MPKPLARFRAKTKVRIACYHTGCENTSLPAVLGEESYIHPLFDGNDRFRWLPGTPVKAFSLLEYQKCNSGKCGTSGSGTLFASAIIVSRGKGRRPIIFGYDPDPG